MHHNFKTAVGRICKLGEAVDLHFNGTCWMLQLRRRSVRMNSNGWKLRCKTALLLNTSTRSPSHWSLTSLGRCHALLVVCWLCSVERKDAFAFWLFGNNEFWNNIKTSKQSELHQKIALLPLLHLNPIDSKFFFIQTSRTKTRMGIKIQSLFNRPSHTNKIEKQNKKRWIVVLFQI